MGCVWISSSFRVHFAREEAVVLKKVSRIFIRVSVRFFVVLVVVFQIFSVAETLFAQDITLDDFQKLRINEIISNNRSTFPQNCRCKFVDVVEIYNGSDKVLPLDSEEHGVVRLWERSFLSFCLDQSNCQFFSYSARLFGTIGPGQRIIVFCDGQVNCTQRTSICDAGRVNLPPALEDHTAFAFDRQGECLLLTLDPDRSLRTDNVLLHEVTFPPLSEDVSYACFPEDVDNKDTFVFTRRPSFGECFTVPEGEPTEPICVGEPNPGPDLVPPGVEMIDYSPHNPQAGEPVTFRVVVVDEVAPTEENFDSVELRYHVDTDATDGDFGVETVVPMIFVDYVVEPDPSADPNEGERCASLREWSIWEAQIPGQNAGDVVRFSFHAQDVDGFDAADPGLNLCPLGVGPCDLEHPAGGPGPGCEPFQDCNAPYRYTVGSSYAGDVLINEVVPNNNTILQDMTESICPVQDPLCMFDDFLELCNSSSTTTEDLSGYVLTGRPFEPVRGWVFRADSSILPEDHLI
jgi:hypothetical protein